jgi:predicted amidophosphoribosyltransferase
VGKLASATLRAYTEKINPDWTTFIPTNPWRYWFLRGFDPVEEMLKGADQPYEKILKCSLKWRKPLSRAKSVEERKELVKDVFKIDSRFAGKLEGKTLLVVDDILTSGATAEAVGGLLKSVGAERVYFFAFFRTPSR